MAGDADFSKVVLLLKGDGANNSTTVVDSSSFGKTISVGGNAKISTTQSKFGGASLRADGSASTRFFSGADADFDLGSITSSSNYTIELWVRLDGVGGSAQNLISHALPGSGGSGLGGWSLYSTSGNLALQISAISPATNPWIFGTTTTTAVLSAATWAHVAVVLQNGVPKIYVNGVAATTTVTSGYIWATTPIGLNSTKTDYGVSIGATGTDSNNPSPLQLLSGYIDEVRITKGAARYTANFTPPTGEFPTVGDEVAISGGTVVSVTSQTVATVSVTGAGTAAITVTSAGTGAVKVTGQATGVVGVASSATGIVSNEDAEFSCSTVVSVTSQAIGAVLVQGEGAATVGITSTATGLVVGGAEFSGSALIEVLPSGTGAVMVSGQASAVVSVTSSGVVDAPVTGTGSAVVEVTSSGAWVVPIAGAGNTLVEVLSTATGAAAITGQGATTINVASASTIRSGIRNFDADVSVRTMLRKISVRSAYPGVVATSRQPGVTATTRRAQVSVNA